MKRDGRRYIVMSDRNYGLFVFRYGADLGVRARASASRRGRVTWTLSARNTGTIRSTGTVVRTRLPRGVRFLSASTSWGRCTGGRTVVCNLGRVVEDNAVRIRIVGQASRNGRLTAVARVTSADVDYDPRNNRARAGARVRLLAAGVATAGTLTGRPR
jgi:uncharacterized repeat protein (TIGR01451 family)